MATALSIGRTSFYVEYSGQHKKDQVAILELQTAHTKHPRYGVRRLAILLGWSANKTRRVCRLASIRAVRSSKKHYTRQGKAEINAPENHLYTFALFKNQARPQDGMSYAPMTRVNAWVQDFTYLRIRQGLVYLALVMDLTTREVLGWKLGTVHTSWLTYTTLIQALQNNPQPNILHSDRGSEYLSEKHSTLCARLSITLSASKSGSPWQNGYMERCIKTIKEELGSLSSYTDLADLFVGVAHVIEYYNTERIHTAFNMSPRSYAQTLRAQKLRDSVFGKKVA